MNGSVPLVAEAAVVGVTVTADTVPVLPVPVPEIGVVVVRPATATVALAENVGSTTLCAVTRPMPPIMGAVKTPAVVIVPMVVDQVTESLAVAP